jgi:hypothetical protein
MARRRRTLDEYATMAGALLAEGNLQGCIVLAAKTRAGRSYVRIVYVGDRAVAESLLMAALDNGETAEDAEAWDAATEGE